MRTLFLMSSTLFRQLAFITTLVTFGHLLFGNIVSGTESGMGCGPHWPLCQGQLFPPLSDPALVIEWTHRLFAALLMALVLATTLVAWRRERHKPLLVGLATLALGIVIAVALLGALTVWLDLPKEISTAHLALGLLFFMLMVVISAKAYYSEALSDPHPTPSPWQGEAERWRCNRFFFRKMLHLQRSGGTGRWALATLILIYLQSVLGAYVRHSNAGLVLPALPFLPLLPDLSASLIVHQWSHRLMGVITVILVWITALQARRAGLFLSLLPIFLALAQILLGLWTVWAKLNPLVAMLHLAGAMILLALLAILTVRTWPQNPHPVSLPDRERVAAGRVRVRG